MWFCAILRVLRSHTPLPRREILTSARGGLALSVGTIVIALLLLPGWGAANAGGVAYSVDVARPIDPSASRTLERTIEVARRQKAELVIVRLDTGDGSGDIMRDMVRTIAAAPMPVVVYVHPGGARANSAGVMLTLAADVAAMAPQTNIGSATPVLGGPPPRTSTEDQTMKDLRRKELNDGIALARTLAEGHGRNADLAERMVRKAENVTAAEAHKQGLVDLIAESEPTLLRRLDGFTVKGSKARRLQTSNLEIKHFVDAGIDTGGTDLDGGWSWSRSFAFAFGGAALVALALLGYRPAGSSWRRWRRKRRRLRRQGGRDRG